MTLRKWIVRSLSYGVLALLAGTVAAYCIFTNPNAIRQRVLAQLDERFVGASVSLESARFRLFGGIALRELRMMRRDDMERADFLYVPAGVIYHDKERLAEGGGFGVRKVELFRPRLRIIRGRDGRWNVSGVLGPSDLSQRVPMLVLEDATITLEDRVLNASAPLLEIREVHLTAINDPLPILTIEATGRTDVLGPIRLSARLDRGSGEANGTLELSAIRVGAPLLDRLALFLPELAGNLRRLTGNAVVQAGFAYHPDSAEPLSYEVDVRLDKGTFAHERLPLAVDELTLSAHLANNLVTAAHVTASSKETRLEASLENLRLPPDAQKAWDMQADKLDWKIEHLQLDPEIWAALPADVRKLRREYSPAGASTASYQFRTETAARWRKTWKFVPEDMEGEFEAFLYKIEHIKGFLERTQTADDYSRVTLALTGYSGSTPVSLKGRIEGLDKPEVDLKIEANNVPLDTKLLRALPERSRTLAAQFNLTGYADVVAVIRRAAGSERFLNRYTTAIHDAALCYDVFPLPLSQVRCVLDLFPDHWECRDFSGRNGDGVIRGHGRSWPLEPSSRTVSTADNDKTGPRSERVELTIEGENLLMDRPFEAALAPPSCPERAPLARTWKMLNLAGRLSFSAHIDDLPNQPQDLDVTVGVKGCTMQPEFFKYGMSKVSGLVRYWRDPVTQSEQVSLSDLKAIHDSTHLGVKRGLILLKPAGGFQARMDEVSIADLSFDPDFLAALPLPLRSGLDALKLRGPASVTTALVVDTQESGPPIVWWNGMLALRDATLKAGLDMTEVTGEASCCGLYDGHRLEEMVGHIHLDHFALLGQPLTELHTDMQVRKESPDALRFYNLKAMLFGGWLGGEAQVTFGPTLRYDLYLKALQVRLEQFAKKNPSVGQELAGAVQGALSLQGEGTDVSGLRGAGTVEVRNGKLYKLPLLLDLLKWLGLRSPDGTAFEDVRVRFAIDGDRVHVQELDLLGNAISLRGQGTVGLYGDNINLDLNTDWARLGQLLPPGLSEWPRSLSDQLLKIKVRGSVKDLRFEKELVPAVSERVKSVLSGMPH